MKERRVGQEVLGTSEQNSGITIVFRTIQAVQFEELPEPTRAGLMEFVNNEFANAKRIITQKGVHGLSQDEKDVFNAGFRHKLAVRYLRRELQGRCSAVVVTAQDHRSKETVGFSMGLVGSQNEGIPSLLVDSYIGVKTDPTYARKGIAKRMLALRNRALFTRGIKGYSTRVGESSFRMYEGLKNKDLIAYEITRKPSDFPFQREKRELTVSLSEEQLRNLYETLGLSYRQDINQPHYIRI